MFCQPVAVKREQPKNENPAPNQYDVCITQHASRLLFVTVKATFRYKKRFWVGKIFKIFYLKYGQCQ